MHKYEIFGFKVESEFQMHCHEKQFNKADVTIKRISSIPDYVVSGKSYYGEGIYQFIVDEAGYFEIVNGNEIRIKEFSDTAKRSVELFTLGSAFGVLMYQRGCFPIHGAALKNNDNCLAIVGDSGAGKSSLATSLSLSDWKIVTDDVMHIELIDSAAIILPSYPSQKIWKKTADQLNIDVKGCDAIFNRIDKYFVDGEDQFEKSSTRLDYLFEIRIGDVEKVEIEELSSSEAFDILVRNSYRYHMVDQLQLHTEHFTFISKLFSKIKVFRIIRPEVGFTVQAQIDEIIKIIGVA